MGDIKKINTKEQESFRNFKDELKHISRCTLWLPVAIELKKELNRPLRYFTLPGEYAYDIFLLEKNGVIKKEFRGFPDVRFCDYSKRNYSEASKKLGSTVGINDKFEDIVLNNIPKFWDKFPYDIYNLDFCGTCLPSEDPPFSKTFQAIELIINKHKLINRFPFVIFLTIKAKRDEANIDAIEDLKSNINENRKNDIFKSLLDNKIPDVNNFVQNDYVNFILLSIPKFICYISKTHCNIEVLHRAKYNRPVNGGYDITKFVFKFSKKPNRNSLSIEEDNYNKNVLEIIKMENINEITIKQFTGEIKNSHNDLIAYVDSLK